VSDANDNSQGEAAPLARTGVTSSPFGRPDDGHLTLGGEIARGGMGRVLRAYDAALRRAVVIKGLLTDDAAVLARFEREALITAGLQHPGIVNIIEAGRLPGGKPYYVMKLITGRPLDQVIADTRSLASRLALLPRAIAVVEALAYAHSKRIIHRDLKPANVLCGDFGETVVIDWGLAKDLSETSGEPPPRPEPSPVASPAVLTNAPPASDQTLPASMEMLAPTIDSSVGASSGSSSLGARTVVGQVMGTPAYMPPEQAAGRPCDERADVYALGALLYHVLAGKPPYFERSSDTLLGAVLAGPPTALAAVDGNTPPELLAIVAKAMAREPGQRYPSAREMADDLTRFHSGQLVGSHRYTTWQLVRRWIGRNTAAAAAVAAALVVGGVAVGVIVRELRRAERGEKAAQEARATAEAAEKEATADLAKMKEEKGYEEMTDARSQRDLGYDFEHSVKQDPDAELRDAFALATDACAAGNLQGCDDLGTLYEAGQGVAKDVVKGAALFTQACDGGLSEGCMNLGVAYAAGVGVAIDSSRAAALFKQACDAGLHHGCYNLGVAYYTGSGVSRDMGQALALFQKSCDDRDATACDNLGALYAMGDGVAVDYAKAAVLFGEACNAGLVSGCNNIGEMTRDGQGVTQDPAAAAPLFDKACSAGDGDACDNLADLYDNGSGVPKDAAKATQLLAKAASVFRQSCELGSLTDCNHLGEATLDGDGVTKDSAAAATIFDKACAGGNADACENLADLYEDGDGVPRDAARAKQLHAQACKAGSQEGCSASQPAPGSSKGIR
jgi:TPR repeat protein/serine/threonine protein kinase